MFVRVLRTDRVAETLYQCARASIKPFPGKPDSHVMLSMEGLPDRDEMTLEISKDIAEIYYMNDQGRTIDAHRWPSLQVA